MNTVYLLLGSNLGDKKKFLAQAIEMIEITSGKIISKSSLYNTEPWPAPKELQSKAEIQDDFINQAVCLETAFSANQLLKNILRIEEKIGRTRTQKWEARIIDIDILFFNSEIIQTSQLTIPHPFLHQRKFALLPLSEIDEDFIHPVLKKSVKELLSDCDEDLMVTKSRNS